MIFCTNFAKVILSAAEACGSSDEEKGGLTLERDGKFTFVGLRNEHEGTDTAIGLYVADREELGLKLTSYIGEGWRMFASFHTHPSFSATPSQLDLTVLFKGFKHNVIFSRATNKFSCSSWEGEQHTVVYATAESIHRISKLSDN